MCIMCFEFKRLGYKIYNNCGKLLEGCQMKLQCIWCGQWISHEPKKVKKHYKNCKKKSEELLKYLDKIEPI